MLLAEFCRQFRIRQDSNQWNSSKIKAFNIRMYKGCSPISKDFLMISVCLKVCKSL